MHRAAVSDELPVHLRRPHFLLKRGDLRRRHMRIIRAMHHQHFAPNLHRICWRGRIQAAMETGHPGHRRATPGQLQDRRPAETIPNCRQPPGIAPRPVSQHRQRRVHATPEQRPILLILPGLRTGLLRIGRANPFPVNVRHQRDVTHPGQLPRPLNGERPHPQPIRHHDHPRQLRRGRRRGIKHQHPFQHRVAVPVLNQFLFHIQSRRNLSGRQPTHRPAHRHRHHQNQLLNLHNSKIARGPLDATGRRAKPQHRTMKTRQKKDDVTPD